MFEADHISRLRIPPLRKFGGTHRPHESDSTWSREEALPVSHRDRYYYVGHSQFAFIFVGSQLLHYSGFSVPKFLFENNNKVS